MALINGGKGNDFLPGTDDADTINGLAGNDTLQGSDSNDSLFGSAGNDVIDGGDGEDILTGGTGNDIYVVDDGDDQVIELAGGGIDEIRSANITIDVLGNKTIENLTLLGKAITDAGGNALANRITGNDGANHLAGRDGNDTLDGGAGADQLDGGRGNDSYIVNDFNDKVFEDKGAGKDTVLASTSYALVNGQEIETLILTTSDAASLSGNDFNNLVKGNIGNDILSGGGGNDTLQGGDGDDVLIDASGKDVLIGGKGNDVYEIDGAGGDTLTEAANQGRDRVILFSGSYTLRANIEDMLLIFGAENGTGNALKNEITGNDLANKLNGAGGNDILNGEVGNDTLLGGAGHDDLDGDEGDDSLDGGSGNDGLEGGDGNDTLLGGAGNDALTGQLGLDVLEGGAGNDILSDTVGGDMLKGGTGNDLYVLLNGGVTIFESLNAGIDEVQLLTGSLNLQDFANVENLTLFDSSGVTFGIGNALNNKIVGNAGINSLLGNGGNDTLDGGAGADALEGGSGNDTYFVDEFGDTILEADKGGKDTVFSSGSYALTVGQEIEVLTLLGGGDDIAIGNERANTLNGNGGDNFLLGGGGNDTMAGGKGIDTYRVEDAGDKVIEAANSGADAVESSLESYTLGANVENLRLIGAGLNGTGNSLANNIEGNALANKLTGGAGDDVLEGGLGGDTLTGGAGKDVYLYRLDNPGDLATLGGDTVIGFTHGVDKIDLRDLLNDFGIDAGDAIFGKAAGNSSISLLFDADGNGPGSAVTLATFVNATLTESDFLLE